MFRRDVPQEAFQLPHEDVVNTSACRSCFVAVGVWCNGKGLPFEGRPAPHWQRMADAWEKINDESE